jgi:hypothetical protein
MKSTARMCLHCEAGVGSKRCKPGSEAGCSGSRAYLTAAWHSVDSSFYRLYS